MVNLTNPMTSNYNITALIQGTDAVNSPSTWLSNLQIISGIPLATVLLVGAGIILFFVMRQNVNNDSDALTYSGLMISFAGILMFLVETGTGIKLVSWAVLIPIFLITAFAIFSNMTGRNY